jgi:glutathione synthase/RimK-type ligase-like ATP-grasp enzyme
VDVALASCTTLTEPDPDGAPLVDALARAGLVARILAWDDPTADWSRARLTVLRSTWNYPRRPADFLAWVDATARVCELWNPPAVVHWNVHKRYLLELAERGVPTVPTALVLRGSGIGLAAILAERGWQDVVVKPAVSAGSFRTRRFPPGEQEAGERFLAELSSERDALVQPYLASVEDHGERALIHVDGELTHAVRKSPRFADERESVSSGAVPILPAERELARRALAAVGRPVRYARVDLAPGPAGEPRLMELELIEPSLFFTQGPLALERFVRACARRLARGGELG